MYPPLCGGGWCGVSLKPPRGVPIPPQPRQDRRDSVVSAAVWGWVVWCLLKTPTGRPYPSAAQAGLEGLGCIRRCVGVGGVVSPSNLHGASLSPRGRTRTGGTRVYPPLCGGGWCGVSSKPPRRVPIPRRRRPDWRNSAVSGAVWGWVVWCLLETPTRRPYPPAAQAGPEGLGYIHRCVGVAGVVCSQNPHGASLPPSGPGRAEGHGCIRPCVGVESVVSPRNPHRTSLSPRSPRRTGGTRVYLPAVWGGVVWCLLKTRTGRPYPPAAQAGLEGIGCIRRSMGMGGVVAPQNSHEASLSPRRPGRTGGTRVYPPLCGGGWCGVPFKPPRGVPIPPRPNQDWRDSGVSAHVWGWRVWCLLETPPGRPYPPASHAGPEGLGCICPLCEGGLCGVSWKPPRGVPILPRPRQDWRDSGVSADVWGWLVWCLLKTPSGRPYPPAAEPGPEGLGSIRRCVRVGGVVSPSNPHGASLSPRGPGRIGGTRVYPSLCGGGWCGVSWKPPRGVPIPPRPRQDRRDSGISTAVWGWLVWCLLKTPTGHSYRPAARARPEGLGCIRRCVGVGGVVSL